ncbi:TonB-dependent receptor [Aquimarina longa]|uniref:TonB-dependent receptor n=1 Tax=Aquimarina longa TaxID=1080221 RepID=UPI0007848694|nr:TonB-dependent receptor [Aquimarina longa]
MKKITFLFVVILMAVVGETYAQGVVTGTVFDTESNAPLPGANIIEVGTSNGTSSDFDGKFSIKVESSTGTINVSYVGFGSKDIAYDVTNGNQDLGTISLGLDNSLEEIIVVGSGIIDLAEDRKTPVAVSTIKAREIQEKTGNFDLPEVLKSTPSVQNIKGGGFGDGSMYLRGFDQTNTAFLLNGQPINGMEDGKMYWSNWSGVLDVANAIQVQRGLGSSKLAISSVGGTVNIVTKTIDSKEGGFVQQMIGNDDYTKSTAYYSTGVNEKGWSFSALFGHWQGDGYVNYTHGQGQTYFLSVGYQPNENHSLNFLITGAPQWHAAPGRGKISEFLENGRKYNSWNFNNSSSKNNISGDVYPGGRNIYHKPVSNLSWDWTIGDNSSLSTVLYGSLGRGAFASTRTDKKTKEITYARGSYNNHNWYGLISNFNSKLTENLEFNLGADVRSYNGIHFRGVTEFIGVNSVDTKNTLLGEYSLTNSYGGISPWDMVFKPNTEHNQRFGYDYEEIITYYGAFGQLEYSNEALSAFFQGSISNQDHQVTDSFNYDKETKSEKVSNIGYNVKGGVAYKVYEGHKVFANVGHYSRQPFHDDLFDNIRESVDLIKPAVDNQTITGLEAGYQFKGDIISVNLNAYHTTWANRTILDNNGESQETIAYESYQTQGVKQVHQGIELEIMTRPLQNLRLDGFISLGDWVYDGNAKQRTFDGNGSQKGGEEEIKIDGFKVGGASQVTAGIGSRYTIVPRLVVDANWNWYNDLYSQGSLSKNPLALPSYNTVDTGLSYKVLVGKEDKNSIQFRFNLNNVFDEVYLESVFGNTQVSSDPKENYKGVNTSNNGRFGYGRTWNVSLRYNF